MWIAPEHRRQGLGHKLVQASLDFARDSHARAVELSVTRANENAIRLYQDIGFALAPTTVLPPDHACSGEIRLRMELL
jgi:ribosomal protein S18 acetylase RimI-like enzyme